MNATPTQSRSTRLSLLALAALALVVLVPAGALSATSAKKPPVPPTKTTPASATLSLAASRIQLVFGTATVLSGTLSTKQAGESVAILARPYGGAKLMTLATTTTATGGVWSYTAKPTIGTSYQAQWKNTTTPLLAVGVSPLGAFHVLTANRFSTRQLAAHSFAGKFVQLQRRSALGQWVTLKRIQLNAYSASTFRSMLPSGNSTLRIAMSVNQAGPGYLAGISRTIVYHRN